jgi:predicted HD phosphohydrolase
MSIAEKPRAEFARMIDGTAKDWDIIENDMAEQAKCLPARILAHLKLLEGESGGFAVDRLEHCLQTATRAAEDGRDEEYVACALLHDIGDTLGPMNHDQIAAAIVQPYVSEKNHWIVGHHGMFQGYYFFEYFGLDKNMRDKYKDHEYYGDCEEFCRKYDQNSFDPTYATMALVEFEPVIQRIFMEPKHSIYLVAQ